MIMSMKRSHFSQERQNQAFHRALRSIASTRISPTQTRWKDVTKGNPLAGFPVKEGMGAKEREEELSSSIVTVRKEEKGSRKAKAKAAVKDLDVAKEKEVKEKWAKEKMGKLPSGKGGRPSSVLFLFGGRSHQGTLPSLPSARQESGVCQNPLLSLNGPDLLLRSLGGHGGLRSMPTLSPRVLYV